MLKKILITSAAVIGISILGVNSFTQAEDNPVSVPKAEYIGADSCLACHEEQKNDHASPHTEFFLKKKNIPFEKSCETCHGPGSLHAEAAGDKTNPGFKSIKQFSKDNKDVSSTCFECHQDSGRMHWEGGVHETKGLNCLSCHSVHSAASKNGQLVKATELETCSQCHGDIKSQLKRSAHMPILEGKMSCSSCHNPHGSATDKNLTAPHVNALCVKCHAEKRGPFVWQHPPAMENCLTCHAPHGSHNDKMLNAKQPLLCQRCHNFSRHPSTPYGNADVILKGNKVFAQSCMNCHPNIHGSNHPSGKMFTR